MEIELLQAIHSLEKRFEVFEAKANKDHAFLRELLTAHSDRDDSLKRRIENNTESIDALNIRMAQKDAEFQTTLRNRSLIGCVIIGVIALLEVAAVVWTLLR